MFIIASYSIMSSGSPGKLFRLAFIQNFMHFILVWMAIFIYSTFKFFLYSFISKLYCLLFCLPCKEGFLQICRKGVLLWSVDSSFCLFSHSISVEHLSNLLNSKCSSMLCLDRTHPFSMGDTLHVFPVLWQGLSVSRYLFR